MSGEEWPVKMKKTPEQVKKLIETYLQTEGIHKYPVVEIYYDIITSYDGDCPRFIIKYDGKVENEYDRHSYDLTHNIEKYTTLKYSRDYVLGYEWSWDHKKKK